MAERSRILRTDGMMQTWLFVCVACEAKGELTLDEADGMKPFGCPEGCGATYVPWRGQLTCVVRPVFRKLESSHGEQPD